MKLQVPRLPPDFLSDLVVSVNIIRLSSKKAAYVVASESSVRGNPEFARDDKFKVGSEPLNLLVGSVAFSVSTQVRFGEGHTRLVPVHSRPVVPSRFGYAGALLCTARRRATRASNRVESSVGNGEFASFMINGISVQPSTTASQP